MIPEDELPPGFGAALDAVIESPAVPRSSATVVLLRESGAGTQALLLRRHGRSGFAAGAWVFPGGIVDPEDSDPALVPLVTGPRPEEWASRLNLHDPGEAFGIVIAAVREAFEETAILLARRADGAPLLPEDRRIIAGHQAAVLAGTTTLRELAVREEIRYALDELIPIAHWITPEAEPRRYDTRFFLAAVPAGEEGEIHAEEMVEAIWVSPASAVERFLTGELRMLPPTVHTLRRLAEFGSLSDTLEGLRDEPITPILPRMRRDADGVVIEIL
jgi:8-oxo-dGTP pyrophosphatase MutT (NUDIX family)